MTEVLRRSALVLPPQTSISDPAHILNVFPGAGLRDDEVVTEAQLREGEPGTVGEDGEPEVREHPLAGGSYPHLVQPLPQQTCDQTVLYLLHLLITLPVEAAPSLHQLGSN